jgi:hypothetical protein
MVNVNGPSIIFGVARMMIVNGCYFLADGECIVEYLNGEVLVLVVKIQAHQAIAEWIF